MDAFWVDVDGGPMVDVSIETPEETATRLRKVIGAADLVIQQGAWHFVEYPSGRPPELTGEELAVVHDEDSWSTLVPAGDNAAVERFGVFSFHFPSRVDNSGFVGWLASHLKQQLGTGVFVVCGSNARRGGIYDHWGCPETQLSRVVQVVQELRAA